VLCVFNNSTEYVKTGLKCVLWLLDKINVPFDLHKNVILQN
jgi:hypothetical protein